MTIRSNNHQQNVYNRKDLSSQSNPEAVVTKKLHLDCTIDFDKSILLGSCKHTMTVLISGTETADFDAADLVLASCEIDGEPTLYCNLTPNAQLGSSKLSVTIPENRRQKGSEFEVLFRYRTSKKATAIQWLTAENTNGGQHPYVFTQCQAIHARSLLPCQDSPGVKCPYTATVRAPQWCTALMSALEDDRIVRDPEPGVFYFTQPIPVPAYLIALAAGELDFRDISRRVRIWAEPGVVEAAAEEFSETEDFLQAAEALTCPYLWTRYDVLTMPPSFPYGGMENPCLTFATPTLLAGDKSLADVIAHEIAHSWTGNLVTNATWEHFWLNEGWTVWLERRILAKVKGSEDYLKLSAQVGWNHLKDDISRMGHDGKFTRLVWPLAEEDPDEAFSRVPYEKGFNLLYHLEGLVGAERFLVFAKAYIQKFKLVCVTSGEFRDFFVDYFSHLDEGEEGDDGDTDEGDIDALNLTKPSKREAANGQNGKNAKNRAMLDGIDWDVLLLAPGMPAHQPDFSNALTITAHVLARRWVAVAVAMGAPSSSGRTEGRTDQIVVFSKEDMLHWNTLQVNVFLETLLEHVDATAPLCDAALLSLDTKYGFSHTANSEIQFRWYSLCLRSSAAWIVPQVAAFLAAQGRMKFIRPLYRALSRCGDAGRHAAVDTFARHRLRYHPIARKMVEQDLKRSLAQVDDTSPAAPIALTAATTTALDAPLLSYRTAFFVTILAILCLQLGLFVYSTFSFNAL